MKYFDTFSTSNYHSAFLTTFTFGAQAFEDMVLPRLRNSGCNNIHVIADQKMVNQEFSFYGTPKYAGLTYHLMKCKRNGAFHPKLVVQLGRKTARLLIGSANLTAPGLAGNLELITEIICSGEGDASAPLIAEAMKYLTTTISNPDPWFKRGVEQALSRSPWLDLSIASSVFEDPNFGLTSLIHDANQQSPLEQFISLIGDDHIKRVNVISPYWDRELLALKTITKRLNNPKIRIAIETERGLFPLDAAKNISELTMHELNLTANSRRVHAKLIIAEGKSYDHILSGSLNCSRPAMFTSTNTPLNAEAGIYRRTAKKTAIKAMRLKSCFKTSIDLSELPEFLQNSEKEEDTEVYTDGGALFIDGDRLTWHPSSTKQMSGAQVELLASNVDPTPELITLQANSVSGLWYGYVPVHLQKAISGIIVFQNEERSSPVPICNMRIIPHKAQSVANRRVQNKLASLALFDSEDLQIIDILYSLEELEASDLQSHQISSENEKNKPEEQAVTQYEVLTYEAFLAGRVDNTYSSTGSSSIIFADRYISDVSRVLNRILGIVAPEIENLEEDSFVDLRPTEHSNEDDLVSDDFDHTPAVNHLLPSPELANYQRHTIETIVSAVDRFTKAQSKCDAEERTECDPISLTQIIHLRAILQIILAFTIPFKTTPSSRQVLPPHDSSKRSGWPRLVGRVLTSFFDRGTNPLASFELPDSTDTIPSEIVDCWACVEVAVTLAYARTNELKETEFISVQLNKLSKKTSACVNDSIDNFPDSKIRFDEVKTKFASRFKNLVPSSGNMIDK